MKNELRLKGSEKILSVIKAFSITEKLVFGVLVIIIIISALTMANKVNKHFMVETPSHGGSFNEGILGLPRSINPTLAFTDVDKDLSTLIYSGLMKYEGDKLVLDMAKTYSVSDDGLTYTFILKDNVRFHDGVELTTEDIEFTIQKIQDSITKSPRKVDWSGISIKKVSVQEIQFTLKQPYASFLSNTTVGILPKHIWKNLDADQFIFSKYNLEPVGSGPYKISSIETDKNSIPVKYNLSAFTKYYDGEPYISKITINLYSNEKLAIDAYRAGTLDNFAGISPKEALTIASTSKGASIIHNPLPRIFGIFFNQNNSPVLANKEVRQALALALDKDAIIKEVLHGYGVSIDGPLPATVSTTGKATSTANMGEAKEILRKAGWVINKDGILEKKSNKKGNVAQVLEFSISTTDAEDLKKIAEIVKIRWESLGAKVNIKVFEYGDLIQNIIRTRKYDALLFGEAIGKNLDLYAFWHSSQKNYPGLNVTMYVSSKADNILENARTVTDDGKKKELYESFEKIIRDDVPAVFIYSPEYIYIMTDRIRGYKNTSIVGPSDRFYGINTWYVSTDYIWKYFEKLKK